MGEVVCQLEISLPLTCAGPACVFIVRCGALSFHANNLDVEGTAAIWAELFEQSCCSVFTMFRTAQAQEGYLISTFVVCSVIEYEIIP